MSPCLPLIIKCLRSSEGKVLEKGKKASGICPFPSSLWLKNFSMDSSSDQSIREEVVAGLGSQGGSDN